MSGKQEMLGYKQAKTLGKPEQDPGYLKDRIPKIVRCILVSSWNQINQTYLSLDDIVNIQIRLNFIVEIQPSVFDMKGGIILVGRCGLKQIQSNVCD